MDLLSAFFLGLVQGLTEFLPVSSSGHLVLAQHMLGWKEPEIFFDVCLHVGTFLAVLVVFRRDVSDFVKGGFQFAFSGNPFRKRDLDFREKAFLLVVIGTVPTVIIGLFARHQMESLFASIPAVSFNLLITGTFLWLTRYADSLKDRKILQTRWRDALWVGLAQGLAIAPGISRSGSTISGALFLGLNRDWAGRFSFLLFIPAVMGALLLELLHLEVNEVEILPILLGTVTAGIAGYIALQFLLRLLRRGSFYVFAPYCWTVGLIGLIWGLMNK